MISKELRSEVVGLCCGVKSIRNSEVAYWFNCIGEVRESSINIYELAYLCKEWIENNTYWDLMIIGYEVYLMEDIWGEGGAITHKRFTKEREWYLNLFKAAEYILEQKELK